MGMKVRIDEGGKKVFIEADLVSDVSKSGMNIKLVENSGFPKPVAGLLYKGMQVKAAINLTIDNPDMPAEERKVKKAAQNVVQLEARLASEKAKIAAGGK